MFRILFKAFVACAIIAAIAIGSITMYMKFYGNAMVEKSLSTMLGSQVNFKSVSINLDRGALSLNNFSILSDLDLSGKIFSAERVTVVLNKEKLGKGKKIVVDELFIKRGVLNIERKESGELIVPSVTRRDAGSRVNAMIAEAAPGSDAISDAADRARSQMYNFAGSIRKVTIENSMVYLKDHTFTGPTGPYTFYFDRLNVNIVSSQEPGTAGGIPVEATVRLRVPTLNTGDATIVLTANMVVYPDRTDMEMNLQMRRVNLMLFLPYLNRSTPFIFYNGLFSSDTDFAVHDNIIDSLTTIRFHRLRFAVKRGMGDAKFIAASANTFATYLSSSSGDVVFDFVVQGPLGSPALGLGPKVKSAIGMIVMEKVGKVVQQLQQ